MDELVAEAKLSHGKNKDRSAPKWFSGPGELIPCWPSIALAVAGRYRFPSLWPSRGETAEHMLHL